jgi:hypothetical protein
VHLLVISVFVIYKILGLFLVRLIKVNTESLILIVDFCFSHPAVLGVKISEINCHQHN